MSRKKIILFISIFIYILCFNQAFAKSKKSIVILNFENNSGIKEWSYMQKSIPSILISNLAKNKQIKIVERKRLNQALKEINFSQTGFVDQSTARQLGKITGADFALYGSITKFGSNKAAVFGTNTITIIINAMVMDVNTGEIKYVKSVRGNQEARIINLIDELSYKVSHELAPSNSTQKNIAHTNPINKPVIKNYKTLTKKNNYQSNLAYDLVFTSQYKNSKRQVYVANSNNLSSRQITMSENSNNYSPKWSPDGSRLAYINSKFGMSVYDFTNNKTYKFSNKPVIDDYPVWSPNNQNVFFLAKLDKGYYVIYKSKYDGSEQKAISPKGYDILTFDVSPDGRQIVFSAKNKNKVHIYKVNSSGTNLTQLTNTGKNYSPKWSPDGSKIVYSKFIKSYNRKVFLMYNNGADQKQISFGAGDHRSPIWSENGYKVGFLSLNKKKRGKVCSVNYDGSDEKILTPDNTDNYDLIWKPNSSQLAFTYDGKIFSIDSEGKSSKVLYNFNLEDKEEADWR